MRFFEKMDETFIGNNIKINDKKVYEKSNEILKPHN